MAVNNFIIANQLQQKLALQMYNFHTMTKQNNQLQHQQSQSQSLQKFITSYYRTRQPTLLNNYNKRINDFIKQIQHEPIVVKIDGYRTMEMADSDQLGRMTKGGARKKGEGNNKEGDSTVKRRFSMKEHSSVDRNSTIEDQQQLQSFKFKNTEDWTSLYTPWQRIERQKNYQIFKHKYGDPNIAFRSIGSQSQYHPYHQYRERDQNREINPPMRYTSKPTKQVLAQIRSKYEKKQKKIKEQQNSNNKSIDMKGSIEWQKNMTKSSAQSALGLNDEMLTENLSAQNVDTVNRDSQIDDRQKRERKQPGRQTKKKKETKLYFKQLIDIEQNMKDEKSKKVLKGILHRCGVFRKKNRRVVTDIDEDQFQKFEAP